MRPFHAVSTLSSRAGAAWRSRAANSRRRIPSSRFSTSPTVSPCRSASTSVSTATCRMVRPSKLPRFVTPYASRKRLTISGGGGALAGSKLPVGSALRVAPAPAVQRRLDLLRRPREERALLELAGRVPAVGVLRREEAAARMRHLAQHVVEGRGRDAAIELPAGHLPGVQVDHGELCVVVEHLLEVRDEPDVVDAVAVEAARAGRRCRRGPSCRGCG